MQEYLLSSNDENHSEVKIDIRILLILATLSSCASHPKTHHPADTRYQRKPITEVSEEQLKTESQLIDATIQALVGKGSESTKAYHAILKEHPDYAPAHYELGKMYLAAGWLDSALFHTLQAHQSQNDNLWYELQLARIYERQKDAKLLINTWEDIVKRNPDRPDLYYDLSNAYLLTGNIVSSIEVLDRVERRFGITEAVSLQKQKLWTAIEKPDRARKELEKLADAMPDAPRYNAIIAENYMSAKNYSKALQYYLRILNATPDDEDIHISLASCYLAMGDLANTYRHVRRGLLNPNLGCTTKLTYLTEFLRNKSFFTAYSKPCLLLADTIAGHCKDVGGHAFLYGQMLAAQGRYGEAITQFVKKIEDDKSQYEVWEALLICESMDNDTNAQLLLHAQQAAALFPLHLRPYLILSNGYFALGDCETAKRYLDRCLMVAPDDRRVKELHQNIRQQCK